MRAALLLRAAKISKTPQFGPRIVIPAKRSASRDGKNAGPSISYDPG
jgi:hypothetical protein